MLLMVKPQFEVGRGAIGPGGVVRDPGLRLQSVLGVATAASALGWGLIGVVASCLPGPSGNVEYFIWLRADGPAPQSELIEQAVREGPQ
jgi:23S rRNA (cytidine1920-2'-O)/16S rRNA (cytidine1409-2'-O)-methyltransferase